MTIYEQLGGAPAVEAVVDEFYDRLVADPSLSHHFDGKDLRRLKGHQRALVTVALGGVSETYTARTMHPAHKGLGITDHAFDAVLDHLAAVLLDAGATPPTVGKVMAILQPLRSEVVQYERART